MGVCVDFLCILECVIKVNIMKENKNVFGLYRNNKEDL